MTAWSGVITRHHLFSFITLRNVASSCSILYGLANGERQLAYP